MEVGGGGGGEDDDIAESSVTYERRVRRSDKKRPVIRRTGVGRGGERRGTQDSSRAELYTYTRRIAA
jgi:hypothetical protein